MTFKEALDLLLKELPPKKLDLERPTEDNLVLIFKGVQQYNGERGIFVPMLVLILGLFFLIIGGVNCLEAFLYNHAIIAPIFCLIIGGVLFWWGARNILQTDSSPAVFRRWLEFSLTPTGGELYECISNKEIKLLTHFEWQEITNILLERQKKMDGNKQPYCIHLQSNQYQDTYLFEWEVLGKELSYVANVLRALCQVQQTGTFPENWNQPPEEEPPFTDLSGHLIED